MAERHAHIAQHGRIGQVTLQARNRKFYRQVLEKSVRQSEVSFGILKVYRIHLMRHSARTYLSGFNFLLEVFHRDILPKVTIHVHHHRIDAFHCIENSRQVIRSEEHTSELQSRQYLVCRLLLEKKKIEFNNTLQ